MSVSLAGHTSTLLQRDAFNDKPRLKTTYSAFVQILRLRLKATHARNTTRSQDERERMKVNQQSTCFRSPSLKATTFDPFTRISKLTLRPKSTLNIRQYSLQLSKAALSRRKAQWVTRPAGCVHSCSSLLFARWSMMSMERIFCAANKVCYHQWLEQFEQMIATAVSRYEAPANLSSPPKDGQCKWSEKMNSAIWLSNVQTKRSRKRFAT